MVLFCKILTITCEVLEILITLSPLDYKLLDAQIQGRQWLHCGYARFLRNQEPKPKSSTS
jgi:hypothetical protein